MADKIRIEKIRKYLPGKTDDELLQIAKNFEGIESQHFINPTTVLNTLNKQVSHMATLGELSRKHFAHLVAQELHELNEDKKPQRPNKPDQGSSIYIWLDYYHASNAAGFKMTFRMLAKESKYSANTFKQMHGKYKLDRGI